jgi:TM2 domain-containing membrane protein YozV
MNNALSIINVVTKVVLTFVGLLKIINGEVVEGLLFISYAKLMDIEDTLKKQKDP